MSLAGKQNTSQYHRIQASVSRQAAACCGSEEKELRQQQLDAAKRHEEQALHLARVERLSERAKYEATRIAAEVEASLPGFTTPVVLGVLEQAFLAGRIDALTEK